MSYTKTMVDILEGRTKKALEAEIEKACTCDGGASLDHEEHDEDCPCKEKLRKM